MPEPKEPEARARFELKLTHAELAQLQEEAHARRLHRNALVSRIVRDWLRELREIDNTLGDDPRAGGVT